MLRFSRDGKVHPRTGRELYRLSCRAIHSTCCSASTRNELCPRSSAPTPAASSSTRLGCTRRSGAYWTGRWSPPTSPSRGTSVSRPNSRLTDALFSASRCAMKTMGYSRTLLCWIPPPARWCFRRRIPSYRTFPFLFTLAYWHNSAVPPDILLSSFSADGNVLLIGPGSEKLAFDLRSRTQIPLGKELKNIDGAYAFLDSDKIVGVRASDYKTGNIRFSRRQATSDVQAWARRSRIRQFRKLCGQPEH